MEEGASRVVEPAPNPPHGNEQSLSNGKVSVSIHDEAKDDGRADSTTNRSGDQLELANEAYWRSNYELRSIMLLLFSALNWCMALMTLVPYYTGCTFDPLLPAAVYVVLVALPPVIWKANEVCYMKNVSKRSSQIIYGVLLAVFYTAIVIFDHQTGTMGASEDNVGLTCTSTSLKTSSSHFAYQTHLIDFNFRFIVIACVFETWRMRCICGLAGILLWALDNTAYESYQPDVGSGQLQWRWTTWCLTDASLVATVLVIALALERSLQAQTRRKVAEACLKVSVEQMRSEKERIQDHARFLELCLQSSPHETPVRIPSRDIQMLSVLGEGGSGMRVYRAKWGAGGIGVAVKVLRRDGTLGSGAGMLEAIRNEASTLAALRHPCICAFYGMTVAKEPSSNLGMNLGLTSPFSTPESDPTPAENDSNSSSSSLVKENAIVMELLESGTLREVLKGARREGQTIHIGPLCRIAYEVASGLAYLHRNGFIQRDIKAENVLLDSTLHAKVSDFGISRSLAQFEATRLPSQDRQEHEALTAFVGTLRYMAPEIMVLSESSTGGRSTEKRRIAYDGKCDTYSFGLLLWEVMHGSVVFEELSAVEAAKKVLKGERPPMSLQPGRSRFAVLITQCWHQDPTERPSMDTCAHVLGQILQLPEIAFEMEAGVSAALGIASRARSALHSQSTSVSSHPASQESSLAALSSLGSDGSDGSQHHTSKLNDGLPGTEEVMSRASPSVLGFTLA